MPKKILLADDSVTIQKVVSITLAHEDFDLTIVDNGSKAVSKAKEIKPDVILLDVVMPDKDGYQVCQEIKGNADLKDIPIILLTGTFEPFDADRAAEVGADDFIKKPFESYTLINKVKEMAAKLRVSREKPVDISEVDIDFETPVEAQYGEKPAEERDTGDAEEISAEWEDETPTEEQPAVQQEAEDIWSVEEFEDIAGDKGEAVPVGADVGLSADIGSSLSEEKAPVREPALEEPAREEAVSDEFFVREGKPGDVEVEDFELGEEISEDELERFLEEETADADITVKDETDTGDIELGGDEEEIGARKADTRPIEAERPASESFEDDLFVEDLEESPAGTKRQTEDFFIEDTEDDEAVDLEWEDESVPERGSAVADTAGDELKDLIRRTTEEELAEFTRKSGLDSGAGREPETQEFEVDLSPFEEEPADEETGEGLSEAETIDFEKLTEEFPAEAEAPGGRPAAGAPAGSLNQKEVSSAVDKIAREVIEKVVWEVVPELAEELIKQEIKRLKGEKA
jgi:CheY-like chemotaxis protein